MIEDHVHAVGEKIDLYSQIYDKSIVQEFFYTKMQDPKMKFYRATNTLQNPW